MNTLRLHLCPLAELGADTPLDFEILGEARRVLERGRAVPAALPKVKRAELVIAAPDVLLVEAAVPPLSGSKLRAALQSIAEPHLLSDPGAAYVVASRKDKDIRSTLAVLDRVLLQRALELLGRLKIVPASATPEQLTLPLSPGRWRLRVGPSHGCLRTGELRGIATSPAADSEPPVELRLTLEQAGTAKPHTLEVEGPCDEQAWSTALGVPVVKVEPGTTRAEKVALELLQYELAPRILDWRAWRLTAALAAAFVLVWMAALNVQALLMLREERALRTQLEASFRQAFPRTPVVLDPLAQMRRGVSDLRAGAGAADPHDFLPLAAGVARVLAGQVDAVRVLDFRERSLRVEFEARAVEPQRQRELLEQIAAAGFAGSFAGATLTVRAKGGS